MTASSRRFRALMLGVATVLAACAPRSTDGTATPPVPTTMSEGAGVVARQGDTTAPRVNPADVHFMSAMIGHHAQAIVMAEKAPTHAASPSIRTLAARIINAQHDEIAIMQQWLRERNQAVPEARPGPMRMTHGGVEHEMRMPGMLTEAQLQALEAARGPEFDRLFLRFMIQHHQGAVTMVKELFSSQGAALDDTVFKIASDINVDQTTEIARMQRMLAALLQEKPAQ
jgi:uncharacterized protein (DUF305 family)